MKRVLAVLAAVGAAVWCAGTAHAFVKTEVALPMDDGVALAATLYLPDGAPPSQGWPAVIMFHGLGGNRGSMNTLAENSFANQGFAVLTFDTRGHGQSGGLFSAVGAREVADYRAIFKWLADRPDVDDAHIGAWGISLGGGAVWRSLVDGIPFAAAEVYETWTDLFEALAPQNLSKSGAIFQFLNSVPAERTAPEVTAIRGDALASTNLERIRAFADQRSSRAALSRIRTPVFLFQGRRDFAFGLEQAIAAFQLLQGPKRLYVGAFGHAPSTFPGPDIGVVLAQASDWYSRFLKGLPNGIDTRPRVELAPDPFREAQNVSYAGLPPTRTLTFPVPLPVRPQTIRAAAKIVRTLPRTTTKLETFGAPSVTLTANLANGWSRVIVVLTARTPAGDTIVVSQGGVNTRGFSGKRNLAILLISQATLIPRGSVLSLTVAASSTAQHPSNLLYLDLPMPAGARLTLDKAVLRLPVLRTPISG